MYPSRSPERMREYRRKWREKNRERLRKDSQKYRIEKADDIKVRKKKWYCCPVKRRARIAQYRAMKKYATPPWLTEEQKDEVEYVYSVAKDASVLTGEPYEVDHIIPLQNKLVCGLHVPWNLQVIHAEDNRQKSNKLLGDFYV